MRAAVTLAQRAVAYYRSDDGRETYLAAALATVAAGLVWWQYRGRCE